MATNKQFYFKTEDDRPSDTGLIDENTQDQVSLFFSIYFEIPEV